MEENNIKKQKPEPTNKVDRTWAHIDANLKRLNDIEAKLDEIEAEKKRAIDKAVARALARGGKAVANKAKLESENEWRINAIKDKINGNGNSRSRKLNFGSIGFRKAMRIEFLEGWDEKSVTKKLTELYGGSKFLQSVSDKLAQDKKFIRQRIQVDLIAIKNSDMTNEDLAVFGCKRVVYDRVWYKTNYMEIKNNESIQTAPPDQSTQPT